MKFGHKVIVVAGPTASGKSSLAMDIALSFDGKIINADSMQVYKDLPILTACPSQEDMQRVPHALYQIYDASFNGTVVEWLDKVDVEIRRCWEENKLPIVVGGTGLYIDHLINGTTPVPETNSHVREDVRRLWAENGIRFIYEKLLEVDPVAAQNIHPRDASRVIRAYSVCIQTGIPFSEWQKKPIVKKLPEAEFVSIKLLPPKEELDRYCYTRFDQMIHKGALAEVVKLAEKNLPDTLPVMKALGVPELMMFIRGECSLDDAIALAKLHTRQYAKRQKTWFSNKLDADILEKACYKKQKNIINDVKNRL